MKTKLTLSVEESLAEKAKQIAEKQGTSVSALVERFFAVIGQPVQQGESRNTLFTQALLGVIPEVESSEDDYLRYQVAKHR